MTKQPANMISTRPAFRAAPRRAIVAAASRSAFPRFQVILEGLEHSGVMSVLPEQAENLLETGDWVLLDVRPKNGKGYNVIGALEVPIFEVVDLATLRSMEANKAAGAIAHAISGVTPMALNERFAEEVTAAAGGRNVIVMCEKGGSLEAFKPEPSRSIKAAWKLRTSWDSDGRDYQQVAHMLGGTHDWNRRG